MKKASFLRPSAWGLRKSEAGPGQQRTLLTPPAFRLKLSMQQQRSDPGGGAESGDAVSATSVWEQARAEDGHIRSISMGPYW